MKFRTADCCSLSAQIDSNVSAVVHSPPQLVHSRTAVASTRRDSSGRLHRGQSPTFSSVKTSMLLAFRPQCTQNLLPRNIRLRQAGQATVFKRELQNSHCERSLSTELPQLGQFRAWADMSLL